MFVPVVNKDQKPLMPTTSSRARRWIKSGKATGFWKKGTFCIRLNVEPSSNEKQEIAIGVDPGSKKEGFTVKSKAHTYFNVQTDAVTWVKEAIKNRSQMRRSRRNRKCPCRKPRWNRSSLKKNRIPPSTKARWEWKLRIINWINKVFPIVYAVVEDIKAKTKKGSGKWNNLFSPLEIGKNWFYSELESMFEVVLKQGYETKELRDKLGLKKSKNKMSNDWSAHCIDSWVLANSVVGGNIVDNKEVLCISPIRVFRRQLHKFQPAKGNIRKPYGGSISLGLKKGSLVRNIKHGIVYVGGNMNGRISLHSCKNGNRLCRVAKKEDCKFLTFNMIKFNNQKVKQ